MHLKLATFSYDITLNKYTFGFKNHDIFVESSLTKYIRILSHFGQTSDEDFSVTT